MVLSCTLGALVAKLVVDGGTTVELAEKVRCSAVKIYDKYVLDL